MSEFMPYIWIGIVVFASVVEIHTFAFVSVWFVPPALASFTLSLTGLQVWIQVLVFFIMSAVLLVLSKTLFRRTVRYRISNHDSIIGKNAIVTEEINNHKDTGMVRINGLIWNAKADEDDVIYESGLVVTVVHIDGVEAICSR